MDTILHVRVDKEVFKRIKFFCIEHELTTRDFIDGALLAALPKPEAAPKTEKLDIQDMVYKKKNDEFKEILIKEVFAPEAFKSPCCQADIVRNKNNLPSCKKCGKVL